MEKLYLRKNNYFTYKIRHPYVYIYVCMKFYLANWNIFKLNFWFNIIIHRIKLFYLLILPSIVCNCRQTRTRVFIEKNRHTFVNHRCLMKIPRVTHLNASINLDLRPSQWPITDMLRSVIMASRLPQCMSLVYTHEKR